MRPRALPAPFLIGRPYFLPVPTCSTDLNGYSMILHICRIWGSYSILDICYISLQMTQSWILPWTCLLQFSFSKPRSYHSWNLAPGYYYNTKLFFEFSGEISSHGAISSKSLHSTLISRLLSYLKLLGQYLLYYILRSPFGQFIQF